MKTDRLVDELTGNIDPRDYGFDVIHDELPSEEEQLERVVEVYLQARDRTGVTSPKMERLLGQRALENQPSVSPELAGPDEGEKD